MDLFDEKVKIQTKPNRKKRNVQYYPQSLKHSYKKLIFLHSNLIPTDVVIQFFQF